MIQNRLSTVLLVIALVLVSPFALRVLFSNLANIQLVRSSGESNGEVTADEAHQFEFMLAHSAQVSATHGRPFLSLARLKRLPEDPDRDQDIQVLRSLPNSETYFITRGDQLAKRGNWQVAVPDFRVAVEIRPESAPVQMAWAQAQMYGLGDLDGSIASNMKAIRLDPSFSYLWVEIAHAYQMAGKDDLALNSLDRVTLSKRDDYMALAYAMRGVAALKRGQTSDAAAELKSAVEISPDNLGFRVSYGQALCGLGKVDEARAIWQSVLNADRNFEPALDSHCGD